jgi:hypothetical protein
MVKVHGRNVRVPQCLESLEKLLAASRSADDTELVPSGRQRSAQVEKELALLSGTKHHRRRQRIHAHARRRNRFELKPLRAFGK